MTASRRSRSDSGSSFFVSRCAPKTTARAVSPACCGRWRTSSRGGAQPHIKPKDLAQILIKLPEDVTEQTAIASVLSSMDTEISELEARRDKKPATSSKP
ncbi:restriction endonuclease subunit S [Hydrogenophaga atypica]|uniref:Restriction endonuclease subunit S n=1 Tax=Hydrogenophaga atypica TaxID=249409 RepID=A0ABW2QRB7_9BURK